MDNNSSLALKGLSILFALVAGLAALLWQDAKQTIGLLEIDSRTLDKRLNTIETNYIQNIEQQHELQNKLKDMSAQLSRIEKGLIRRRIINP